MREFKCQITYNLASKHIYNEKEANKIKCNNRNGLFEIHSCTNNYENEEIEHIYVKGTKQIDAVIAITNLLEVVQVSKLVDFKEIVHSNHRGFMVDIDIKEYFYVEHSEYYYADNMALDSTKRFY